MDSKQLEYIQLLQEKNRLKKLLQNKSKKELELEAKEKGFTTHYSGANNVNDKQIDKQIIKPLSPVKINDNNPELIRVNSSNKKNRGWSNQPPTLLFGRPLVSKVNSTNDNNDNNKNDIDELNDDNDINISNDFDISDKYIEKSPIVNLKSSFESNDNTFISSPKKLNSILDKSMNNSAIASPKGLSRSPSLKSNIRYKNLSESTDKPVNSNMNNENIDIDLNKSLIARLISLDPKQKAQLLSILQSSNENQIQSFDNGTNDFNKVSDSKNYEDVVTIKDNENEFIDKTDFNNNLTNSTVKESTIQEQLTNYINNEIISNLSINIKIRILNTWMKSSKYCSLLHLQLRNLSNSSNNATTNLLSNYNIKLQSGIDVINPTSDCFKHFSTILGSNKRLMSNSSSKLWKGPISIEKSFDILLSGIVSISTTITEEELLDQLELTIINSYHIYSCKDIDVYIGNRCIWSGSLPDTSAIMEKDLPYNINDTIVNINSWGVIIKGFSKLKKSTINQTANKSDSIIDSILDNKKINSRIDNSINSSGPVWLQDLKPITPIIPQPVPLSISSPDKPNVVHTNSRRQSQRVLYETIQTDNHNNSINSLSNSLVQSIYSDKHSDNDSISESIVYSNTKLISNIPNRITRQQQKKLDEDKLISSIDAVSVLDRSNLGRMSRASLLSNSNSIVSLRVDKNEENASENIIHTLIDMTKVSKIDGKVNESTSISLDKIIENNNIESAGNIPNNKIRNKVNDKELILSNRSKRINEVNKTVMSALDNLNNIMKPITISNIISKNRDITNNHNIESISNISIDDKKVTNSIVKEDIVNNKESFPRGKELTFYIFSTHGDQYYLGLNGIEVFNHLGDIIVNEIDSIISNPLDINILNNNNDYKDPRIITNLINGFNFTKDDLNMWLIPLGYFDIKSVNQRHCRLLKHQILGSITITFRQIVDISMIRIFNYNKSRTHIQRGVKHCQIILDDISIFSGDIRISPGETTSLDDCSEMILFTINDKVLNHIALYDESKGYNKEDTTEQWMNKLKYIKHSITRPTTADKSTSVLVDQVKYINHTTSSSRPLTMASNIINSNIMNNQITEVIGTVEKVKPLNRPLEPINESIDDFLNELNNMITVDSKPNNNPSDLITKDLIINKTIKKTQNVNKTSKVNAVALGQEIKYKTGRKVKFVMKSSWGDENYIGLSGIEILVVNTIDNTTNVFPLSDKHIDKIDPYDLTSIGYENDIRIPKNLFNNVNITTNDSYMWLVPYQGKSYSHIISFDLLDNYHIYGIQIWNYNQGISSSDSNSNIIHTTLENENTLRGCKEMFLYVDNQFIGNCITRIGIGYDCINYSQLILFNDLINIINRHISIPSLISTSSGLDNNSKGNYISTVKQDYETIKNPTGLLWTITLLENYGDEYYIGLDRLQLIDANGLIIPNEFIVRYGNIIAIPNSINDLSDNNDDTRVIENLLLDIKEEDSSTLQPWLAPLIQSMSTDEMIHSINKYNLLHGQTKLSNNTIYNYPKNNIICLQFNYPVTLAGIQIYNYSKNSNRGVKELSIHVDKQLIYLGSLSISSNSFLSNQPQAILFTNNIKIINKYKNNINNYCGLNEQDVLYINERQVIVKSKNMYNKKPNVNTEGVYVDIKNRPNTSMIH